MKLRCDMHKYDVQFYQTRMNMSRSIIRSSLTLHLLPILSSMYEHVPIYHLIVLDSTPSYTLCALTSHHRVRCISGLKQLAKHHWHVTYTPCKAPQKAVEGATALLSVRPSAILIFRIWIRWIFFYEQGQGQVR